MDRNCLVIFIRLWHLPVIDYKLQVEGENLRRGLVVVEGRSRGLRIGILIGPA